MTIGLHVGSMVVVVPACPWAVAVMTPFCDVTVSPEDEATVGVMLIVGDDEVGEPSDADIVLSPTGSVVECLPVAVTDAGSVL